MTAPAATNWEERYAAGDTPWDKGAPAPGLLDFLAAHPGLPRGTALVPGCGLGHDARALAAAGFAVTGLDLAPAAVRRAAELARAAGLAAAFRAGDFLRDAPDAAYDLVFEHTLFCAIQPAERDRYVAALRRWLRPGGTFLAVHYMIRDEQGPPFGCTQEELMERFLPHLELVAGWVPRSYPNRTGLELMLHWRAKA
jgi:SAM-dependent methyltransferase